MIINQFAIKVAAAGGLGCFDRRQDLLKTSLPVFLPRKSLQVRVETGGILREDRKTLTFTCVIKIVNFIINTLQHLIVNTIINI